jgi:hypothetical protein
MAVIAAIAPFSSQPGTGPILPFSRLVADEISFGFCSNSFRIQQAIQGKAIEIAGKYTVDKPRFQAAAVALRQPFWDWAKKAVPPDEVISKQQVTIIKPDGSRGLVDNPLVKYKFKANAEHIFPRPFSQWNATIRTPNNSSPTATTDLEELKEWVTLILDTSLRADITQGVG